MESILTVDDAPSSHMKSKIDILDDMNIKAIFFCEGLKIQRRKEMVKYALKNGHIIGNHSWTHPHFSDIDYETAKDEIEDTDEIIDEVYRDVGIDREYRFFRFPFGDRGNDVSKLQNLLKSMGYEFPRIQKVTYECMEENWGYRDWYWTLNDESYKADSYEELISMIDNRAFENSSGEIVIYHDHENTHRWFKDYIEELRKRGIAFVNPKSVV